MGTTEYQSLPSCEHGPGRHLLARHSAAPHRHGRQANRNHAQASQKSRQAEARPQIKCSKPGHERGGKDIL